MLYVSSRDLPFLRVPNRVTRSAYKIVFRVPTRIVPIYEHSPYYIGTKLWSDLLLSIQDSVDVHAFKKEIKRINHNYVNLR